MPADLRIIQPIGVLPLPEQALTLPVLRAALFLALLFAASLTDCRRRTIPNAICVLIAAAGLISFSPARLFGPLAAVPFFLGALWNENGMGGGDIKLVAASGLVLGFFGCLWGSMTGLALAILWHGAAALYRKCRKEPSVPMGRAALPLAPFLSVGLAAVTLMNLGGI